MARFLVRRKGTIVGSFPVPSDTEAIAKCQDGEDALDVMSRSEGDTRQDGGPFDSFKDLCKKTGLTRDDYTVEKVED